jgi:hypothetical protein
MGTMNAGGNWLRILYLLDKEGYGELVFEISVGAGVGLACAIPALIVSGCKGNPLGAVFWANVVAGVIGLFSLAVPVGIITLVVSLCRTNSTQERVEPDPDAVNWTPIIVAVILGATCLLILPFVLTTPETVWLPDNRTWLEKLRGDPAPSATRDATNWIPVMLTTASVCTVGFFIGKSATDK